MVMLGPAARRLRHETKAGVQHDLAALAKLVFNPELEETQSLVFELRPLSVQVAHLPL